MELGASLTGKYLQKFFRNIAPQSSGSDSETLLSKLSYDEFGGVASI
jgi:hypothetical protein